MINPQSIGSMPVYDELEKLADVLDRSFDELVAIRDQQYSDPD